MLAPSLTHCPSSRTGRGTRWGGSLLLFRKITSQKRTLGLYSWGSALPSTLSTWDDQREMAAQAGGLKGDVDSSLGARARVWSCVQRQQCQEKWGVKCQRRLWVAAAGFYTEQNTFGVNDQCVLRGISIICHLFILIFQLKISLRSRSRFWWRLG